MNIAVSPQTIPISWQDYLAGNYDRSQIPWPRYRYSGTGVVEVSGEVIKNVDIAKRLSRLIENHNQDVIAYTNSISSSQIIPPGSSG